MKGSRNVEGQLYQLRIVRRQCYHKNLYGVSFLGVYPCNLRAAVEVFLVAYRRTETNGDHHIIYSTQSPPSRVSLSSRKAHHAGTQKWKAADNRDKN
jgi:hypothetical protein